MFLGKLVSFYASSNTDAEDKIDAYLYAVGVILTSALSVMSMHPNMLGMQHSGMKIRVALCSLLYRKSLRLSRTAMVDTTSGQVVNLMSNDVGRLDTSTLHVHFLWIGPLEIAIVTYLMYREVRF